MRSEHVVKDDVQRCDHQLSIIVTVYQHHRNLLETQEQTNYY